MQSVLSLYVEIDYRDLPTGRYFLADVGGNVPESTEDIHMLTESSGGTNLGWPMCEGYCDNKNFKKCDCDLHDDPIWAYEHNGNSACIVGGGVYRFNEGLGADYDRAYFYGKSHLRSACLSIWCR